MIARTLTGVSILSLTGCQIVGGADYIDTRDGTIVYAEWNKRGTTFLTECYRHRSERMAIESPPREALVGVMVGEDAVMSERHYRRSDFFLCPELDGVSE